MLQVARTSPPRGTRTSLTGIAESSAAQKGDLVGVVAGDVEAALYRSGKSEGPTFLNAVIEQ